MMLGILIDIAEEVGTRRVAVHRGRRDFQTDMSDVQFVVDALALLDPKLFDLVFAARVKPREHAWKWQAAHKVHDRPNGACPLCNEWRA